MGLTCGVDCVAASSACAEVLDPPVQTRMLTLIFVFKGDFCRCGSDLGAIWGGLGKLKWKSKSISARFFSNVFSIAF